MSAIATALQDLKSLESLATNPSTLSSLDARGKLLVTLAYIVTVVSFDRYAVAALLPLALLPVILSSLGNIPLRTIARGVLLACPFALMMGMFNPLFDQQVVMHAGSVSISGGWLSFASILVRFALTASTCLILVASTGFAPLCAALRRLGVPQPFTDQLLLLHRYAQVLANEAAAMNLARELRSHAKSMPLRVYGPLLGHLLLRALQRAQRLHQAMLSRGFNGATQNSKRSNWRTRDTLFMVTCITAFALVRRIDLAQWVGQLAMERLQ